MKINVEKRSYGWIALHASNGAVLGTGSTEDHALAEVIRAAANEMRIDDDRAHRLIAIADDMQAGCAAVADYEACASCGEATHAHEAACIHCGVMKRRR